MHQHMKYLVLLLALLMAVTLLAACAGESATTETTPVGTSADTTAVTEQATVEAPVSEAVSEERTDDATEPVTEAPTEAATEPESTVDRVPDDRNLTAAQYSVLNITGTDDFGRVIHPVDGKVNTDRYVGMFYFLTLGQHANHTGIYDINKITFDSTYHKAFTAFDTFITPVGSAHFWGEPVWGYYNSLDTWVMRKQIEMLTMAGVDFLVLDTSNNVLYESVTKNLFDLLLEYQNQGWDVPKVVYYLGKHELNADVSVIKRVHEIFYSREAYKSLWFTPNDSEKPMIVAPDNVIAAFGKSQNKLEQELFGFYDFRVTQWPTEEILHENGAPWIDFVYPQRSQDGWINLSTSQHVTVNMTDIKGSRGRGWYPVKKRLDGQWVGKNDHDNWRMDLNFQAQWDTVLKMTPEQRAEDARFVFLTGWNEWVAEKLRAGDKNYFTCDTYCPEYSRDIEPSRSNGMKDYTYFMTIMNIHNDNFAPAVHYEYPVATPDITKDDTDVWDTSKAVYRDFTGECGDRNFKAMGGDTIYTDTTGRNDIDTVTVLRDSEYLYFRITCVDAITEHQEGDRGWMNLWLKTASAEGDLMGGYEYVVNYEVNGNKSQILRCKSLDDMQSVGEADVNVYGNAMILRIPLSALGLTASNYHVEFKVTDNVQNMIGDPLNLYTTGDAAPIGSLNFSFGY